MNLETKIEAILYWRGEPVAIKKLAEILKVKESQAEEAISALRQNLSGRGVVLLENAGEISLGTPPELSGLFEKMQKEELSKDLSKASLETLSIVLYKNGATRADIDYVRGVNSSFILRALSVRGLVMKESDPNDSRRYLYKPTFELLSYLGIKSAKELPGYEETMALLNQAGENMKEDEEKAKDERRNEDEATAPSLADAFAEVTQKNEGNV